MKLDFLHVCKQSESDAKPIEKTLNIRQRSDRLKHIKVNLHLQAVRSHWRNQMNTSFMWPASRHVPKLKYTELLFAAFLSLLLSLHTTFFSLRCSFTKPIWRLLKSVFCIHFHVLFYICSQLKTERPVQKHDLLTCFMLTDQLFPTTLNMIDLTAIL